MHRWDRVVHELRSIAGEIDPIRQVRSQDMLRCMAQPKPLFELLFATTLIQTETIMKKYEVDRLRDRIGQFLRDYSVEVKDIAAKVSNIFEAYCYVLFVRYYEKEGLHLQAENLTSENVFKFRFSTNGNPWNFSYFTARKNQDGEILFDIRHNQKVVGYWVSPQEDDSEAPGLFAMDVAVIKPGALPDLPKGTKTAGHQTYVSNSDLITFGEAKNLVAYPMLLASFYGIVHEVKPEFVRIDELSLPDGFSEQAHPYPVLFTANFLTKGTKNVLKTFEDRRLLIVIVEDVVGSPEEVLLQRIKGVRADIPLSEELEETLSGLME